MFAEKKRLTEKLEETEPAADSSTPAPTVRRHTLGSVSAVGFHLRRIISHQLMQNLFLKTVKETPRTKKHIGEFIS